MRVKQGLAQLRQEQHGATSVEYAFLASLIALVIIVAVEAIGISLSEVFESVLDGF